MLNQNQLGNQTEERVCNYLRDNGYWVYRMPNSVKGQPSDVITVKNDKATLIEVKHSANDRFVLSRIEENQKTAHNYYLSKGNKDHYIIIKFKSGAILLKFDEIMKFIDKGIKSITYESARELGVRIWI